MKKDKRLVGIPNHSQAYKPGDILTSGLTFAMPVTSEVRFNPSKIVVEELYAEDIEVTNLFVRRNLFIHGDLHITGKIIHDEEG